MYWSQDDFVKWTEHINSIVGENSEEGAFIAAEKTKSIEILMAGERQEVLELMASVVYNFSKNYGIAFEDALVDIQNTWDQLKQKEGYMWVGDEMIASIEEMNSKICAVKERLGSIKDIFAFFKDCTEVGGFVANEETGEMGIAFVYNGDRFMYIPELNKPGTLSYSSETGGMGIDYFENDDIFREVVMKLLEGTDGI